MIHFHGTPITPKLALESMAGQHFCVSFARPDSLKTCLRIGQSLMLAFGALMPHIVALQFVAKVAGGAVWAWALQPLRRRMEAA